MLTKDSRGKVVGRSGLIFEILDQISYKVLTTSRIEGDTLLVTMSQLNFSYVITEPADGAWGVRTAGGDWSGMIGQLVDREVMLGAAAFAISQASRELGTKVRED